MILLRCLFGLALLTPFHGWTAIPQALRWVSPDHAVLPLGVMHPLKAEASSGLPVRFRVVNGPALIAGDQLLVTNVDIVTVVAEQPGDSMFAAVSSMKSFNAYRVDLEPEPGSTFGHQVREMISAGNLLLIADNQVGFGIMDCSEPGRPRELGRYRSTKRAEALAASETHAFVSFSIGVIQAVNLRDPSLPRMDSRIEVPGTITSLAWEGGLLFAATGANGLAVVDAQEPNNLRLVGHYRVRDDPPWGSGVRQVKASGKRLYLAVTAGLQILDISNPSHPVLIGGFTQWGISQVIVLANHLVGIAQQGRVTFLDVSNVSQVRKVGHYDFLEGTGGISGMQRSQDFLILADPNGSVEVVNFRPSGSPQLLGQFVNWDRLLPGDFGPVWVSPDGGQILAAGITDGIHRLRVTRRLPQDLQWTQPTADRLFLNEAQSLEAHASSGLPIEWSVISGPAIIEQGLLQLTNRGSVVVSARQAGTPEVAAAEVRRTFNPTVIETEALGRVSLNGVPHDVLVTNNIAYVALGSSGVDIVDISDRSRPLRLGSIIGPQSAGHLAASESLLLVTGGGELTVVDIQDPSNPVLRGTATHFPGSFDTSAVGSMGLVADGPSHVTVVDLSNPDFPKRVGSFGIDSYITHIDTKEHLAAVGESSRSISLWDVHDPLQAVLRSRFRPPGFVSVNDLWIEQNSLLVATQNPSNGLDSRLEVFDLTDASRPRWRGRTEPMGDWLYRVTAFDGWAFVRLGRGTVFVDIRDSTRPRIAGELLGAPLVVPSADHLVAATWQQELVIYSWREAMPQTLDWREPPSAVLSPGVSHPLEAPASSRLPVQYQVVSGPGEIRNGELVVTNGSLPQSVIVVASQPGGPGELPVEAVRVFNQISVDFELLGELETPVLAVGLQVANGYAYVAPFANQLTIVDVRDPRDPKPLGGVTINGTVADVRLSGGFAYVASLEGGMVVVDVHNPEKAREVSQLHLGSEPHGLTLTDTTAYLLTQEGIRIVDVSDPFHPRLLGQYDTGAIFPGRGLVERDGFLYVTEFDTLMVLDVRNPSTPTVAGTLPSALGSGAMVLDGSLLWMEGLFGGIHAVDVSDPTMPRLLAVNGIPEGDNLQDSKEMALRDGLMFASGRSGLTAVEIGNPHHLLMAGSHEIGPNSVHHVALEEDRAYVAAGHRGLLIFRVQSGIRRSIGDLSIPNRGEVGEIVPLPLVTSQGDPLLYEVVSGAARVADSRLTLEGIGPVTLKAALPGSDRYLPVEIVRVIAVDPILLKSSWDTASGELILDWRLETDVLESTERLGEPWVALPGARPPYRPSNEKQPRFFRIVRP